MRAQLAQALLRPRQVVGFFLGGFLELAFQPRVLGHQGLGEVQGLGADFSDVVDPHQGTRKAPLGRVHFGAGSLREWWAGTGRMTRA